MAVSSSLPESFAFNDSDDSASESAFARLERLQKKVTRDSHQGVRHLIPNNLNPLRTLIEKGQARGQIDSLKEVNRLTPLQPPLVHRPDSRYVQSMFVLSEKGGPEKKA